MSTAGYSGERINKRLLNREELVALPGQTTIYGATLGDLVDDVWQWFEDRGLHDPVMQMVKVQEEVGELAHEISRGRYDTPEVVDALGDIFVTIIGMCHHLDIEPGYALLTAYHEIKDRKGKVINGSFVKVENPKESNEIQS